MRDWNKKILLMIIIAVFLLSILIYNIFLIPLDRENQKDLFDKLKNGDMSILSSSNKDIVEILQRSLKVSVRERNTEWLEIDLNGDKINELVWREKEGYNEIDKRVKAIFLYKENTVECAYIDMNDSTEYYFLGSDRNLIYYYYQYGQCNYDAYSCYRLEKSGKLKFIYGLNIYNIYDITEFDINRIKGNYPYINGIGIYFQKCTLKTVEGKETKYEEQIDENTFREAFHKMVGLSFDEFEPEWWTVFSN